MGVRLTHGAETGFGFGLRARPKTVLAYTYALGYDASTPHATTPTRKKDQTLQQQQQQQQKTIVEEEWLLECPLCRDLHEASSFLPRRKKKNFSFLGQTRRSRILLRAIYRDNRSYATFQKIHPYRPVRPLDRRSPLR